jgi:hypothetical protein
MRDESSPLPGRSDQVPSGQVGGGFTFRLDDGAKRKILGFLVHIFTRPTTGYETVNWDSLKPNLISVLTPRQPELEFRILYPVITHPHEVPRTTMAAL